MKISKKLVSFIIIFILLVHTIQNNTYADIVNADPKLNVAVFHHSTSKILFYSSVAEALKKIEAENPDKVHFTFFDSRGNQGILDDNIQQAIREGDFDLFVVTPIRQDVQELGTSILRVVQKNIPLVIFSPTNPLLASYLGNSPSVIIGGDDKQAGILQGELIVESWRAKRERLDKNKDNIIQYIIIKGPLKDPGALARSMYSIQTINYAGIETEEVFSIPCNWGYECAKNNIEAILLTTADKVEAIISNNDAMAVGAVEALQKLGYNKGGDSKYIPVFGINGLPEAIKLINEGAMEGTVIQGINEYANTIYKVGMNLVAGRTPTAGTNYSLDETGKIIKIPFYKYVKPQ